MMVMKHGDHEHGAGTPTQPATEELEPVETVDMVGGALCLDFVNTGGGRRHGPFSERLQDYEDLVVWARRAGLVESTDAAALQEAATRRPAAAAAVLDDARTLREAIYRIFSARGQDLPPPASDVDELNRALADAGRHRRVARGERGWEWTWERGEEALGWLIWPIAQSAAELLTEADPARIKECGSDNCNWLFYDVSKNRSRRWCEMKECGNRAKQRRHRSRTSGAAGGG
jgi:predicted RNA-binding Zn ribbon-like protein